MQLYLIGHMPPHGQGYAIPIYGQTARPNTVYMARCSIAGDHRGVISNFEPVDLTAADWGSLAEGDFVAVTEGDPWIDVFLWGGKAWAGTPAQLWASLEAERHEIEARAPLSLLELASSAQRDEAGAIGASAMTFLRNRFDRPQAESWRRGFIRQQAEVALRRIDDSGTIASELFSEIQVDAVGRNRLELNVPAKVMELVSEKADAETVLDDVVELAAAMGAKLGTAAEQFETAVETTHARVASEIARESVSVTIPKMPDRPEAPAGRPVLIVTTGTRSDEIARHLRSMQDFHGEFHHSSDLDLLLLDDPSELVEVPEGGTIIVIAEEDGRERPKVMRDLFRSPGRSRSSQSLLIVAPVLPPDGPSSLLTDERGLTRHLNGVHAVLDTSIARAPWWWGYEKRSVERRVADIIAQAIRAAEFANIRNELLSGRWKTVPLLTVSPVRRGRSETRLGFPARMGSESSWLDVDARPGMEPQAGPGVLFSFAGPIQIDRYGNEDALRAEGRKWTSRFQDFALHAVAPLLTQQRTATGSTRDEMMEPLKVPQDLRKMLRWPSHVAALILGQQRAGMKLVVTAEVPKAEAVDAAADKGWAMVRYTDTETLRRIGRSEFAPGMVPSEISLGRINTSDINRTLAVRGVDQRDVIKIDVAKLESWLSRLSPRNRGIVKREVRPLRSAKSTSRAGGDVMISREFLYGSSSAALELRSANSRDGDMIKPFKRRADLRKVLTLPESGFRRYAIVDGRVPVVVTELRNNEVPMQDLFVIDGTAAVPALFRSRLFAIWARATLPPATSWMARFSVSATFGGFPIVPPFQIVGQNGDMAALCLDEFETEVEELVEVIDHQITKELARRPATDWKSAHQLAAELPEARRLEDLIFSFYELNREMSDIELLRRMQELNANMR